MCFQARGWPSGFREEPSCGKKVLADSCPSHRGACRGPFTAGEDERSAAPLATLRNTFYYPFLGKVTGALVYMGKLTTAYYVRCFNLKSLGGGAIQT